MTDLIKSREYSHLDPEVQLTRKQAIEAASFVVGVTAMVAAVAAVALFYPDVDAPKNNDPGGVSPDVSSETP